MLRYFVCFFALLFAPFAAYRLKCRISGVSAQNPPREKLLLTGIVLAGAVWAVLAVYDRAPADSVYTPARYRDGQLIPAHFESGRNAD